MDKGFLIFILFALFALALLPSSATTASGFPNAPKWSADAGFRIPAIMVPFVLMGFSSLIGIARKLK